MVASACKKAAHQLVADVQPCDTWIDQEIEATRKRRQQNIARVTIAAPIACAHGEVIRDAGDIERASILRPVAIGSVMVTMILRPDLLRHTCQHPQQKATDTVQRIAAKQAVMTTVMHQHESA